MCNRRGRNPDGSFDLSFCEGVEATPIEAEPMFECRRIYASMLEALRRAQRDVVLQMYIIDDDWVGRSFEQELSRCVARGARVRVLCDGYGCRHSRLTLLRRLRRKGVQTAIYDHWRNPDCRNHRKLLVVDEREAFVGGVNIARRYAEGWRDMCVRMEGEEVQSLCELFDRDWCEACGVRGGAVCLSSGWLFTEQQIEALYDVLLCGARRRAWICTPYFVPPPEMLALLCGAVERGVDVRVLLPSCGDSVIVDWACRERIGVLLEGGVGVWLCEGAFNHAKMMVVDDVLVAGSANFDYRSMRRNREVAALLRAPRCVDRAVAELSEIMDKTVLLCADEWRQRTWLDKVAERLVRPIAPFL